MLKQGSTSPKGSPARLQQAGDTIVEVMIAIAVVSAVLAGAFITTNQTVKNVQQAHEHEEALGLLQAQVERLKVVTQDTALAPPIFAANSPFCLDGSNAKIDIAGSTLPAASYPNQCTFGQDNRYKIGIVQLRDGSGAHNNVFSAHASWEGPTGATEQVNLLYRLFAAPVAVAPPPPGPAPPGCVASADLIADEIGLVLSAANNFAAVSQIGGLTGALRGGCSYSLSLEYGDDGHTVQRANCAAGNAGECQALNQPEEWFYIEGLNGSGGVVFRLPGAGQTPDMPSSPPDHIFYPPAVVTIPPAETVTSLRFVHPAAVVRHPGQPWIDANSIHIFNYNFTPV
jgi:type II secretory pathway pseudopilin PulG